MRTQAVLITGASSGIGQALAQYYLDNGWQVIACGRNEQALNSLAGAIPLAFDMTDKQQVTEAAQALDNLIEVEQLSLQAIILNAGTCEYIDDAKHFDSALFERVIRTNVIAVGDCLASFLPLLASGGRLALMSSSATYLPFPRAEAYGASKAAISYLAQSLRVDLANQGIGVSVIHPGFVATPLTDKNDFDMPMKITALQAAKTIYQGMIRGRNDIHFPKMFTLILKLVALLPTAILVKILSPKQTQPSAQLRKTK